MRMLKRRDLLMGTIPAPLLLQAQTKQATPASTVAAQQGLPLLKAVQAALGGTDRLAAIHDVDWTVIAKTWDASGSPASDGTRRIRWIQPNVFRKDQQAGNITVREFFDGSGGWEVVPDGGLLDLKGPELEIVRNEADGFWLNVMLADRGSRFEVGSGGPGIVRITSRNDRTGVIEVLVDPKTRLPARIFAAPLSGTVSTNYRRTRQRMEYVEWQTVDGIRWPHKTINFHDDIKRAEITTTEIRLNSGLHQDELSAKPLL